MHGSVIKLPRAPGKRRPEEGDPDSPEGSEYLLDEETKVETHALTVVTLDLRLDTAGQCEAVVVPVSRQDDADPWYRGWLNLRLSVDDEAA